MSYLKLKRIRMLTLGLHYLEINFLFFLLKNTSNSDIEKRSHLKWKGVMFIDQLLRLHGFYFHRYSKWPNKKGEIGASLVAQWLRICLPMQGTRVRALVWEEPTRHGATRPVSHNYWACASGACAPQQERPRQWEARALWWWVAPARRN